MRDERKREDADSAISTALDSGHVRRLRSPSSTAVVDVVQNVADEYGMIRGPAYFGDIQSMPIHRSIRHTEDHDYVSQLDEIEGGGYASNTTGERMSGVPVRNETIDHIPHLCQGTSGVDESLHLTGFPSPLLSGQVAPSRVLQEEVVHRHSNPSPTPGGLDERHDSGFRN